MATTFSTAVAGSLDDRTEYADGSQAAASITFIDAHDGDTGGVRFTGVTIPQGAMIHSAVLSVYISGTDYDNPDVIIRGDDTDSAAEFGGASFGISGRPPTTATVNWVAASATGAGYRYTADFASVVQEIVDRPGWSSGNAIAVVFEDNGGTNNLRFRAYDSGSPPSLIVSYTDGANGSATVSVASGSDDAGENSSGTMFTTSTSLNVNSTGSTYGLLLFRDIPIPTGATVASAFLRSYITSNAYDSPNMTIEVQDSVSPAAPSSTNYDISSRTTLTGSVTWNEANIGCGYYLNSPDFSSLVQSYIDQTGYTQNSSDMAVVLTSAGTGTLRWESADSSNPPPQLYIAWTSAGGETFSMTVSDLFETGDAPTRTAVFSGVVADSASLGDTGDRSSVMSRSIDDSLGLADLVNRSVVMRVTSVDGVVTGAVAAAAMMYQMSAAEVLDLSDTISRALSSGMTLIRGVSLGEQPPALRATMGASIDDAVAVIEALATAAVYRVALSESSNIGDATLSELMSDLSMVIQDAWMLSEASPMSRNTGVLLADILGLGDVTVSGATVSSLVSSGALLSGAPGVSQVFIHALDDALGIGDNSWVSATFSINLVESASVSDAMARVAVFAASVTDGFKSGDALYYILPGGIVRVVIAVNKPSAVVVASRATLVFDIAIPRSDITLRE
jgi:hypothetical protein